SAFPRAAVSAGELTRHSTNAHVSITTWSTTTSENRPSGLSSVAMTALRRCRSILPASLVVLAGCGGGSDSMPTGAHAPDIDPPTVSLTAPAALASGLTGTIAVSANANDNVGATSVEFQIDGVAIGGADSS